jgi:hypothetical protein
MIAIFVMYEAIKEKAHRPGPWLDEHQAPIWPQQSDDLAKGPVRSCEMVQYIYANYRIEGFSRDGNIMYIEAQIQTMYGNEIGPQHATVVIREEPGPGAQLEYPTSAQLSQNPLKDLPLVKITQRSFFPPSIAVLSDPVRIARSAGRLSLASI